jgi:uncharacterized protein (TIGR00266 family)
MHFDIQYRPAHSLATAHLAPGESVRAEASSMVSMTKNLEIQTDGPMGGRGGIMKNLKRAMLGGETFFTNTFRARGTPGHVTLAPTLCGDMIAVELQRGQPLYIQGTSYVASPDSVEVDARWQGFKGFFSGESLFFLEATGTGPVVVNAFGAIETLDLDGDIIVDTGHLVAFSAGIQYEVTKASRGWIASYLSGEGLVLRMSGRGRIYLQSRNPNEYGGAVASGLPPRQG